MNRTGLGNQELHRFLTTMGWSGTVNNISNWLSGQARIPIELVPRLVAAFGKDPLSDGMGDVVEFLRLRHPELHAYFKEPPVQGAVGSSASVATPVYLCRRGSHQGKRFVPYRDVEGNYVGGTSRFEEDKRLFPDLPSLVKALNANPELRVRMVLEDSPRSAPSLIRQDSLSWE